MAPPAASPLDSLMALSRWSPGNTEITNQALELLVLISRSVNRSSPASHPPSACEDERRNGPAADRVPEVAPTRDRLSMITPRGMLSRSRRRALVWGLTLSSASRYDHRLATLACDIGMLVDKQPPNV